MVVLLRVPAVDDPDFVAELAFLSDPGPVLRLTGSADSGVADAFRGALEQVHEQLRARDAGAVVVDLHALDAMSAACFTELVAWVARLAELAPAERYRIRLRTNPAIAWQRPSLAALSCFDTELVAIDP